MVCINDSKNLRKICVKKKQGIRLNKSRYFALDNTHRKELVPHSKAIKIIEEANKRAYDECGRNECLGEDRAKNATVSSSLLSGLYRNRREGS